jgi:hypothetical protein
MVKNTRLANPESIMPPLILTAESEIQSVATKLVPRSLLAPLRSWGETVPDWPRIVTLTDPEVGVFVRTICEAYAALQLSVRDKDCSDRAVLAIVTDVVSSHPAPATDFVPIAVSPSHTDASPPDFPIRPTPDKVCTSPKPRPTITTVLAEVDMTLLVIA